MASKTIGGIRINVSAGTVGLSKGLKNATAQVQRFSASVKSMAAGAVAGIGAVAAALGVGLGVQALKEAADQLDAVGDTAAKLGIATEALMAFQKVAALSGSSAEALDNALVKMSKGIGDAAGGTGKAKDALLELGFSLQDLAGKGTEEQVKAIADALAKVDNQSKKLALTMRIFGDSDMVNVLADGSKGLDEIKRKMVATGQAFSSLNIAQVQQMNDALDEMRKSLTAIIQKIVIELAPAVTYMAELIKTMADDANAKMGEAGSNLDWIAMKAQLIGDAFDLASGAWNTLLAGISGAAYLIMAPFRLINAAIDTIIQQLSFMLPAAVVNASAATRGAMASLHDSIGQTAVDAATSAAKSLDGLTVGILTPKSSGEIAADGVVRAANKARAAVGGTKNNPAMADVSALKSSSTFNPQQGQLIYAGTAAAAQFGRRNEMDQLARKISQQLDEERKQTKELKRIADNTDDEEVSI